MRPYADIDGREDLPSMEVERLNACFRVYQDLPDGGDIQINGFGDAGEARQILTQALEAYEATEQE